VEQMESEKDHLFHTSTQPQKAAGSGLDGRKSKGRDTARPTRLRRGSGLPGGPQRRALEARTGRPKAADPATPETSVSEMKRTE
jgi:hypothetical protein